MRFEVLQTELLQHWRGRRSQASLSRRLGYRSNVIFDWETGRRSPSAAKAFHVAGRVGVDLDKAFVAFINRPSATEAIRTITEDSGVAAYMRELRGNAKLVDLAAQIGCSRFTVGRWLKGEVSPSLAEFLAYVQFTTLRVLDLCAELADPFALPSIRDDWQRLNLARELAYDFPWSHAVLRVLELQSYQSLCRHEPGFIAARLGITLNQESECLRLLEASGQIRSRHGPYELVQSTTVDTRRDPARSQLLRAFWTEVAAERIRAGKEGEFSFNLFGVSSVDLERLIVLQRNYFAEFRRIVASSEPVEEVVLTNLQILPLAR